MSKHTRAFTMIELVVSMAIVALLVALLAPAVQSARESSRRLQCKNNLHQLGIALHDYHDAQTSLPPAMIWGGGPGEPLGLGVLPVGPIDRVAMGVSPDTEPDRLYANWAMLLLPHLEQSNLHESFNFDLPVDDPINAAARNTDLVVMKCPSDSYYNSIPYERGLLAGARGHLYARGNYAFNFGPNPPCYVFQPACSAEGFYTGTTDLVNTNMLVWGSGIGGLNISFRFREFGKGLSQMTALDEIRAGIDPIDPRGAWALGMPGASITVRHGKYNLGSGSPVNNLSPQTDDIISCSELLAIYTIDGLIRKGMPCQANVIPANHQATARSLHPGGVHVLMLDGSVHFVDQNISPEVWHEMHSKD